MQRAICASIICGKRIGIVALWASILLQIRHLSAGITFISDFESSEHSYLRGVERSHGIPLSHFPSPVAATLDAAINAAMDAAMDAAMGATYNASTSRKERSYHHPTPSVFHSTSSQSEENWIPSMSPEVMTMTLQRSWQNVTKESNYMNKVPYIIPRRRPLEKDAITAAVHADTSRLNRLLFLIRRWQGPVSASIYVPSSDEIPKLVDFAHMYAKELAWTDIHVLMEDRHSSKEYPHNLLREMALRSVETQYFLALDVDFVTTPNAHEGIYQLIRKDADLRAALHNRTWMVLPAFERLVNLTVSEENILTIEEVKPDILPNNKEEALNLWDKEELDPFHLKRVGWGHGPTNYTRWYVAPEDRNDIKKRKERPNFYRIRYEIGFEPYVLGCKCDGVVIPNYWPFFRGFGYNKYTFFVEAHYMGFEFAILEDYFVVHLPHPYGERRPNRDSNYQLERFAKYMKKTYHLSKEELDDI